MTLFLWKSTIEYTQFNDFPRIKNNLLTITLIYDCVVRRDWRVLNCNLFHHILFYPQQNWHALLNCMNQKTTKRSGFLSIHDKCIYVDSKYIICYLFLLSIYTIISIVSMNYCIFFWRQNSLKLSILINRTYFKSFVLVRR